jgi:hypothetical protein
MERRGIGEVEGKTRIEVWRAWAVRSKRGRRVRVGQDEVGSREERERGREGRKRKGKKSGRILSREAKKGGARGAAREERVEGATETVRGERREQTVSECSRMSAKSPSSSTSSQARLKSFPPSRTRDRQTACSSSSQRLLPSQPSVLLAPSGSSSLWARSVLFV